MGTRCQIGFYEPEQKDLNEFEALIYQHWDGYPDSTLQVIMPILADFDKNRGLGDIEYASAWLVAKLKDDYLNIGICRSFHGDIEYFYAVYPDRVDVYKTPFDAQPSKWTKIHSVPIQDYSPQMKLVYIQPI